MRRIISSLLVLATAAGGALALAGAGAATSRCDSNVVVFSRSSDNIVGSVNWNGVVCIPGNAVSPELKAVADGPVDFRLINPSSDLISVRYAEDVRFKPALISARLNGLGFRNRVIQLARTNLDLTGEDPSWVYDGPDLSIDPTAAGCLTVQVWYTRRQRTSGGVKLIRVLNERTQYHTYDSAC